jgi:hypothetical protein
MELLNEFEIGLDGTKYLPPTMGEALIGITPLLSLAVSSNYFIKASLELLPSNCLNI